MVPALFDDSEKEGLASTCRDEAIARGLDDSREGLWRVFLERARANLHVVLAMSPVGEALRTRCRWGQGQAGGHAASTAEDQGVDVPTLAEAALRRSQTCTHLPPGQSHPTPAPPLPPILCRSTTPGAAQELPWHGEQHCH